MNQSAKYHLNKEDIKKWLQNTLVFSAPTILAFLLALQGNRFDRDSFSVAFAMAYQALLASLIDLFRKFIKGE
jgi:hypothetical protein